MKPQDENVPLFPLLAGYWDKPLSELPEALQARVSTRVCKRFIGYQPKLDATGQLECDAEGRYPAWKKVYSVHEVGEFNLSWDTLTPQQRQELVKQIDDQNDPKNEEEEEKQYFFDLMCKKHAIEEEIRKWELMNHQYDPAKAKIQDEKLVELRAKLAEIEQQLNLPPPAVEQAAPAPKGEGVPVTSPSGDDCDGLTKREKQIRAIEMLADNLGYKRLAIPDGGKKLLMEKCKEVYPTLFGVGDDPVKDSWSDAVKGKRIRMENHESYLHKKKKVG